MESKVTRTMTEQEATDLVTKVRDASASAAPFTVRLSPEDRQQTLKPRRGAEKHIRSVADIAEEHGANLPFATPESIRFDLDLAVRLEPISAEAEGLSTLLSDTIFRATGEAWNSALGLYKGLDRMSDNDPKLDQALAPFRAFLAGHKQPDDDAPSTDGAEGPAGAADAEDPKPAK